MGKWIIALLVVLALAGCASQAKKHAGRTAPVHKNSPVVYIHPLADAYQEASVAVLPFQVPASMRREQGEGIAILFKDVLLGKRAFPRVLQLSEPYEDLEGALALGRKAGVDLVLAGRVNYALEGSQFGGGRLEVATRLLNVRTGNTIWHIEQAMDQPMAYPRSSTLRRFVASFNPPEIKPSQGGPVLANMLARVAVDMAEVMAGARTVRP